MDKDFLQSLINEGLSQRNIAKKINRSQTSVRHWCKKHKIVYPKKDIYGKGRLCCVCNEYKSNFYRLKNGAMRAQCKDCDNKQAIIRFRSYKKTAVDYKGGKCEVCGYNRCLGSLDFHHIDPKLKDKDFIKMKSWSIEKYKMELDKCRLLCKNCHGELHYDEITKKLI